MFFVWLFLYATVMLLSGYFACFTHWALPAGLFVTCLITVGYLFIVRQANLLTLKKLPACYWRTHLFFIPYLLPLIYNLLYSDFQSITAFSIICALFVAVQEEIIFRGILLRYFCRKNYIFGTVLCSIIFAAAHLLNLTSKAEPLYVIYQVVFACAIGFALSGVALTSENLFACIAIHFLINITAGNAFSVRGQSHLLFWVCIVVCVACGVRNIFYLNKINCGKKGHQNETIH